MTFRYYMSRWYFTNKFKIKIKKFSIYYFLCCLILTALLFFIYESITARIPKKLVMISKGNDLRTTQTILKKPQSNKRLRYILQWTDPKTVPFCYMGVGQQKFIETKCPHVNCYVTSNKNLLENITMFDVIAFAGPQFIHMSRKQRPKIRSPHQKYVFASIESSAYYPVCDPTLDGYFNWTWTYKLDSDSRWGYLVVRDLNGTIIGPNKVMHWKKKTDMLPVPDSFQRKLKKKTKLAAWFVSNCKTRSGRERYVRDLRIGLKQYKQNIDVFGRCGTLLCNRDNETLCSKIISDDYYFYMAFENALSEDYVTEKVLHGLQYNAVPIVYGSANYNRFLPPGSYINALKLSPEKLANKMVKLFVNFSQYVQYFRWKNHYTIESRSSSVTTDDYCSICALVSDDNKFQQPTVYKEFRKWWNPIRSDFRYIPKSDDDDCY